MAVLSHLPRRLSYSLGDLSGLMQAATAEPPRAAAGGGPWNVDSACCGAGRLGAQGGCQPNSTLCVDRGRYLFWDSSGHPTQRAAQLVASALYDGPPEFTAPVNLKQLTTQE